MEFVIVIFSPYFFKQSFCLVLCGFLLTLSTDCCESRLGISKNKKEFIQPEKPFLTISEFKIPIFHSLHPYKTVIVNCTLELTEDSWSAAKSNVPYIYHYMFVDLYFALNFLWRAHKAPNKDAIKKRLMNVYKTHFAEQWPIKDICIGKIIIKK